MAYIFTIHPYLKQLTPHKKQQNGHSIPYRIPSGENSFKIGGFTLGCIERSEKKTSIDAESCDGTLYIKLSNIILIL